MSNTQQFYVFPSGSKLTGQNDDNSSMEIISERNISVIDLTSPQFASTTIELSDADPTEETNCECMKCDRKVEEAYIKAILANNMDDNIKEALKRTCLNDNDSDDSDSDSLGANIDHSEIEGSFAVKEFVKNQIEKG